MMIDGTEYVPIQLDRTAETWQLGQKYLIRTVTVYHLGRLVHVGEHEIVLVEAGWLAWTGRFHECLRSGNILEFEPAGSPTDRVLIGRGAVVDAWPWKHPLIEVAK